MIKEMTTNPKPSKPAKSTTTTMQTIEPAAADITKKRMSEIVDLFMQKAEATIQRAALSWV